VLKVIWEQVFVTIIPDRLLSLKITRWCGCRYDDAPCNCAPYSGLRQFERRYIVFIPRISTSQFSSA